MANPVTQLEQFIVDALVSSPLVPIGVNVMRLADTIDKEGVVQSSSNIIVSYAGGSSNIKQREPLMYEKSYVFKVTFNTQDYLNTNAHDFALHLLDAATRTLTNQVPFTDNVQVIEPFHSSDETFEGITENSQYVYSQTWRILSEEIFPDTSLDPCVRRGNCKAIWPPPGVVGTIPPGAVVTGDGRLWEVGCEDEDGNLVLGTRYDDNGDLVLNCDGSILIPKEDLVCWTLKTTNTVTDDGKLEVWLLDCDGNQVEQIFYTDTGKKMAKMAMELWRSRIDNVTRCGSSLSCRFERSIVTEELTYAVVDAICAPLYSNPLATDSFENLNGGSLIGVNPNVRLTVNDSEGQPMTLVQVVKTDLGVGGWVEEEVIAASLQTEARGLKNYPASQRYKEQVDEAITADSTASNPGNDKQVGRSAYDGSQGAQPSGT